MTTPPLIAHCVDYRLDGLELATEPLADLAHGDGQHRRTLPILVGARGVLVQHIVKQSGERSHAMRGDLRDAQALVYFEQHGRFPFPWLKSRPRSQALPPRVGVFPLAD
jgi:hypothetical protein